MPDVDWNAQPSWAIFGLGCLWMLLSFGRWFLEHRKEVQRERVLKAAYEKRRESDPPKGDPDATAPQPAPTGFSGRETTGAYDLKLLLLERERERDREDNEAEILTLARDNAKTMARLVLISERQTKLLGEVSHAIGQLSERLEQERIDHRAILEAQRTQAEVMRTMAEELTDWRRRLVVAEVLPPEAATGRR